MSSQLPLKALAMTMACMAVYSTSHAMHRVMWQNHQTGKTHFYDIDGVKIDASKSFQEINDPQWKLIGQPDLNGDGQTDLLWRHFGSGANHVYIFDQGELSTSTHLNTISDFSWEIVGSGDMNGDGKDDLLWRHSHSGEVYVYEMDGPTIVTGYTLHKAPIEWKIEDVSDFNQDNQSDILWRHSSTGQVLISLSSQRKLTSHQKVATVADPAWQIAAVADFNGDGFNDIFWRHQNSGLNFLYQMEGSRVSLGKAMSTVLTDWSVAAVADFNEDNRADVLWRNQLDGTNHINLMDGHVVSQGKKLNAVSNTQWQIVADLSVNYQQQPIVLAGVALSHQQLSLNQNESVQLQLTANYSNGDQQDVTQAAQWSSTSIDDVSVNAGLVTAIGSESATVTASYENLTATIPVSINIIEPSFALYFEKPSGWNDCFVYIWLPEPAGSVPSMTWPGEKMVDLGDGWCQYELPIETNSVNLVFNDNNGQQTGDLNRSATGWFSGVSWFDVDQRQDITAPIISATPPAGNYEQVELDVTLNIDDQDSNVLVTYAFDAPANAQSPVYTQPVHLTGDAVIHVFAEDSSGNQSQASFEYHLDTDATAPVLELTLPSGRYDTDQSVRVLVSDNRDANPIVYYTTDGTEATRQSPIYDGRELAITDKGPGVDLQLSLLAVDEAQNEGRLSASYRIGAAPQRTDFREESIYFVMTARFFDGDSSNNRPTRVYETSGNADNNDPAWRGDFQGLTQKLDYLKAMGFSAVWITPAVLNRSDYDFHGYHAYDFNRIDERLGGEEQFRRLIDELHKRDMKLVLDIVLNHTSRYGAVGLQTVKYYGRQDDQWSWYYDDYNPNFVYDGLSIEPNSGKNYYNGDLWTSDNYLNLPGWGEAAGIDHQTGRTIYNYQWPNLDLFSDDLFHPGWLKNWEDETAQSGTIHEDLPDLNTENPEVQQFLIDAYCRYIEMGVDAFRIDTVKHINRLVFNRRFIPAFKKCGGDNFYMFGEVATRVNEVWNKNVAPLSTPFYTWAERQQYSDDDAVAVHEAYQYELDQGPMNQPTSDNHYLQGNDYHEPDYSQSSGMAVIDFPMHWNFSDAGSALNIASQDHVYNDSTWNVVYVDSHDYGPNMDNRYPGDEFAWAENMSYMWTFRGIPCLYYGSEVRFKAGARADLGPTAPLEQTGRAYYGDHIEGSVQVDDFGIYHSATGALAETMEKPLVKHLARLNRIRRAIPALQKGQYSRDDIDGWIAYKRRFTDQEAGIDSFALVTVSGTATFNSIPNGTYTDAVTGDVKVVTNGSLTAEVSGQGNLRVYVLDLPGNPAPGKIGDDTDYLY